MKSTIMDEDRIGTDTKRKKFRRRNYVVDRKLQFSVAGNMLLIVGVCMALTVLVTSWFFLYFMEDHLIWDLDHVYMIQLGIIFFFIFCGVAVWTVLRVHSMAGPVYKTRLILQDAARGRFPDYQISFRKGDAFKELAGDINRCLEVMKEAGTVSDADERGDKRN